MSITADKIQVFEMSGLPNYIWPKVILRVNGYDTEVSQVLLEKMAVNYEFGSRLRKDMVAFYKEAIKYEQYCEFEEIKKLKI